MVKKLVLVAVINVVFCLCGAVAWADSKRDIETIAKVIGFINNGPVGHVEMAVVYDPNNPDSVAHANDVMSWAAGGVGSKVTLFAKKVTMSSVKSTSAPVLFLTRGTSAVYDAALARAKENKGLTVSTDDKCLGLGCVLVVRTSPHVDILVSTAAVNQTGAKFASAFSMMITKR